MSTVMSLVNGVLGPLFDGILYPFRTLHPLVGLTVVSALAAVLMLLGYRATSNQEGIDEVKRKIAGGLFEIRLYNDDLRAILRAQWDILRHNLRYMALNIVPMLWMLAPFVLVVAQLQFHYGYEGLRPGEATLLKVVLTEQARQGAGPDSITVTVPDGIRLETPRVWVPSEGEAAWRLVADRPGEYELTIDALGQQFTKHVVASGIIERRSPERLEAGFLNQLLYPAEAPLPGDGPVSEIRVIYPDREVGLFGFEGHWLIAFLILSIAIAFALKGKFGVKI